MSPPSATWAQALIALYLAGGPRRLEPRPCRWPLALGAMRVASGGSVSRAQFALALGGSGLAAEAWVLGDERLWEWAGERLDCGEALSAACEEYPQRWIQALGSGAPPAVWASGRLGALNAPVAAVVGVRDPDAQDAAFARGVAGALAKSGCAVVSGGAPGVDAIAEREALDRGGHAIEVLPCGVRWAEAGGFGLGDREGLLRLSPWAPIQPFGGDLAMRRNLLVYALGERSVVVRARFREGGTWKGAVEMLRRKVGPLLVRDAGDAASRALVALGGIPISEAEEAIRPLPEPTKLPLFSALG